MSLQVYLHLSKAFIVTAEMELAIVLCQRPTQRGDLVEIRGQTLATFTKAGHEASTNAIFAAQHDVQTISRLA